MRNMREIDEAIEATLRMQGLLFPETIEDIEIAEREYDEAVRSGNYMPQNTQLPSDFFEIRPQISQKISLVSSPTKYSEEMGIAARSGIDAITDEDWDKMNRDRKKSEEGNGRRS